MSATESTLWDAIKAHAGPYPPEAFLFVQDGLRYTVEHLFDKNDDDPPLEGGRHVTGQQLCLGLRDYAIEQYGLLARTVLAHWHIYRTDDFGRIVFILVETGLMRKTEQDSPEDFAGVFDFEEAFGRPLERC